jgi:translocator protein
MVNTRRAVVGLVAWLAISFLPSLTGLLVRPGGWYAQINKPSWTPPSWVFGPAWTTLYALMAIAAWMVWMRPATPARRAALTAFFVQLVLNALWTPLFFGARAPGLALVDIVLLWMAIAATIVLFWRVRPAAGALLIPYILWVSYATALNFAIWQMN